MAKRTERSESEKRKIILAVDQRKPEQTIKEVLQKFGVHGSMVNNWRKKFGMPATERGAVPLDVIPERHEKRLYTRKKGTGNTRVDVAQKLIALANQLLSEAD